MVTATQLIDLGEVELFVEELGLRTEEQPSVVVMHGGPDVGHRYLIPGLEPLARDRHVVTFDFRGCGASSRTSPKKCCNPNSSSTTPAG